MIRNYYKVDELQYMIGTEVDIMTEDKTGLKWKLTQFFVEGVFKCEYLYGVTRNTTSGRPHVIFYTHVVMAPEYDRVRNSPLLQLIRMM